MDVSKPATDFTDEITIGESITKKNCDSLTPKGNTINNITISLFCSFNTKYSICNHILYKNLYSKQILLNSILKLKC